MQLSAADKNAIVSRIRLEPAGKSKGGFNEEELAIRVPNASGEGGKGGGGGE